MLGVPQNHNAPGGAQQQTKVFVITYIETSEFKEGVEKSTMLRGTFYTFMSLARYIFQTLPLPLTKDSRELKNSRCSGSKLSTGLLKRELL